MLARLVAALVDGFIEVVELTHPLGERTPQPRLPAPWVQSPPWRLRELSRYDERGPHWYRNAFEGAEHLGTHFDAPVHWITGRELADVASIPPADLIGPAVVLDIVEQAAADPDFLLEVADIEAFCASHGPLPDGGWLLVRSGWGSRALDEDAFLNRDESGSHTPGFSPACARWLARETPLRGVGVETLGIDAGQAHSFDPPFPCHRELLGAGKYGLNQLANLDRLPPTGAVVIAAPLRIEHGSGSPMRALALVERGTATAGKSDPDGGS